jgi:hypothetical protein
MPSGANPRVYSIATDTGAAAVNVNILKAEVAASAVVTAFSYIETVGDVLSIHFAGSLTAGEQTTLDAAVTAHQGVATSAAFQMFESVGSQSTTGHTDAEVYEEAWSRTVAALGAGTYRISWYFEMQVVPSGPVNSRGQLRMLLNGTPVGVHLATTDTWIGCSGWDRVADLPEGATPTLSMEWRRDPGLGGNDNVEIRRLKMSLEQMV